MRFSFAVPAAVFCGLLNFGPSVLAQMPGGGRGPGGFGFHAGKVVTGAPYSAEVSNSSVKTLADGNTIQRTMTGRVARDSYGRTFTSETMTGIFGQAGAKTVTFISDPVAGFSYTLNEETKTASRRPLHPRPAATPDSQPRVRRQNPEVDSEDLGTQAINGVPAQGQKKTHTIPAGEIGNAQPIISTSENWFSPELKVMVLAKRTDAREGVSTYSLNNIQRGEPSAALFQIPADYTVKDVGNFERRRMGGAQR